MPFGFKNAPSEFQNIMNDIFNDYTKFSIVYIDDVLIFSNSIEEHFQHLKIFQKIVRDHRSRSFSKKFSNPVYISKEPKLLLQVLEADHRSASGSFELQKIFQKDKFFISNDISKTRRFYEFILVDTESIQVSHVKNTEGTDIAYSKCKILKIISEND